MRSRTRSIFRLKTHNKVLLGAMILSLVLTLAVIYIPGINTIFALEALSLTNLLIGSGLALVIIPVVEIVKLVMSVVRK